MPKPKTKVEKDDAFGGFFEAAEQTTAYWVELAKVEFTEHVLARMKELSLSKSGLAKRLNVQPAMVTRIVSGQNNFELATMVKIARALECEFRSHLQRPGTQTGWMNFLQSDARKKIQRGAGEPKRKSVSVPGTKSAAKR